MKINQWIKLAIVACCVFSLFGCHSKKKTQYVPYVPPTEVEEPMPAQPRGLGAESHFGEESAGMGVRRHSDRIYYFAFDSAVIQAEDRAGILKNADYLLSHHKARVLLEGHTDPRGSREYNIGLGERRAKAVADVLTAKGVDPSQIRIVSYGAEKLAAPGHTETDYQLDRRVALVYLQR